MSHQKHPIIFPLKGVGRMDRAERAWIAEVKPEWRSGAKAPHYIAVFRTRSVDCKALGEGEAPTPQEALEKAIRAYFELFPEHNAPASQTAKRPPQTLEDLQAEYDRWRQSQDDLLGEI